MAASGARALPFHPRKHTITMTQAQDLIAGGFDIDALIATPPSDITQRVGIAFDDEGEPYVGFVIVGKDSQQFRDADTAQRVSGLKRQSIKQQKIDTKTDAGATQFIDLVQGNELNLAVAVVVDWFGFNVAGTNQPMPFDADRLRKLLDGRKTWRDKILVALENEEAFLPKSSAT
jgi:hypothetical protein